MSRKDWKDEVIIDKDKKWIGGKIPDYYIGNKGLEAIEVIHQFNLSYDLGSACSYILRAKKKHQDGGKECITKAIEHLKYELRKIDNEKR